MSPYSNYVFDKELVLLVAGLMVASINGSVVDVGSGFLSADVVIDMTACEIDTGDEIYTVSIEGSNTADMSAGSVCLGKKVFGNLVAPMDAALSESGRYVIPIRNEENGVLYRYLRVSVLVEGTVATGIDFSAFLGVKS